MSATTIGTRNRVTATFQLDSVNTDPGAVTVQVQSPTGTITTPTAIKTATGVYYVDVDPNKSGRWTIRFVGTSPVIAANEIAIEVAGSVFA